MNLMHVAGLTSLTKATALSTRLREVLPGDRYWPRHASAVFLVLGLLISFARIEGAHADQRSTDGDRCFPDCTGSSGSSVYGPYWIRRVRDDSLVGGSGSSSYVPYTPPSSMDMFGAIMRNYQLQERRRAARERREQEEREERARAEHERSLEEQRRQQAAEAEQRRLAEAARQREEAAARARDEAYRKSLNNPFETGAAAAIINDNPFLFVKDSIKPLPQGTKSHCLSNVNWAKSSDNGADIALGLFSGDNAFASTNTCGEAVEIFQQGPSKDPRFANDPKIGWGSTTCKSGERCVSANFDQIDKIIVCPQGTMAIDYQTGACKPERSSSR